MESVGLRLVLGSEIRSDVVISVTRLLLGFMRVQMTCQDEIAFVIGLN